MSSETVVLIILIANTIFAIAFFAVSFLPAFVKRRLDKGEAMDAKRRLLIFLLMLFAPVAGPLLLALGVVAKHLFFRKTGTLQDTAMFDKTPVETRNPADFERDINLVPMEEALAVSDKAGLRNLMLSVVKGDVTKYLGSLTAALNSKDSETAHYAASVLRDELNNFNTRVTEYRNQIADAQAAEVPKAEEVGRLCEELVDFMQTFLEQKVFVGVEKTAYVQTLDEVAEQYYSYTPQEFTTSQYEGIIYRLLEEECYERAKLWCDRTFSQFPNSLPSYKNYMKYYFTMGERDEFFRVLNDLKKTDITIDKETLEMIRIFS